MDFLLFVPILLFSIVAHEVAHAWQARREGDLTAEELGRITLNPLPHLDLMGSIIIPVALWLLPGGVIFGWAKPVPVNPSNYRDEKWGDIRVSLAGIVVNLILAALLVMVAAGTLRLEALATGGAADALALTRRMALFGIYLNLILAVFNLIPVPPLDGSHVLARLLPGRLARSYRKLGPIGFLALLLVLFAVPGGIGYILAPVDWLFGWAQQLVGALG